MARIVGDIDVPGRPSGVFRFCHDMDRRPDWDERVTRAKIITPKPVRTGTVIRVDSLPPRGGPVFSWEGAFVTYSYPSSSRLVVIDAAPSSYFANATEEWSFSRSDGGTQVRLVWEYQPRGILGRITDPLVTRRSVRRAINQTLDNLQRALQDET